MYVCNVNLLHIHTVLKLIESPPFMSPPRFIRVNLYHYHYTPYQPQFGMWEPECIAYTYPMPYTESSHSMASNMERLEIWGFEHYIRNEYLLQHLCISSGGNLTAWCKRAVFKPPNCLVKCGSMLPYIHVLRILTHCHRLPHTVTFSPKVQHLFTRFVKSSNPSKWTYIPSISTVSEFSIEWNYCSLLPFPQPSQVAMFESVMMTVVWIFHQMDVYMYVSLIIMWSTVSVYTYRVLMMHKL